MYFVLLYICIFCLILFVFNKASPPSPKACFCSTCQYRLTLNSHPHWNAGVSPAGLPTGFPKYKYKWKYKYKYKFKPAHPPFSSSVCISSTCTIAQKAGSKMNKNHCYIFKEIQNFNLNPDNSSKTFKLMPCFMNIRFANKKIFRKSFPPKYDYAHSYKLILFKFRFWWFLKQTFTISPQIMIMCSFRILYFRAISVLQIQRKINSFWANLEVETN